MKILEGKSVAEIIESSFQRRLNSMKTKPNIAILGLNLDEASISYIQRIQKNCEKYNIGFNLLIAKDEEEFKENFSKVKKDKTITGIMFQYPLPKELSDLINEVPPEKDIEGIGINNMGKLLTGDKNAIVPCTSKAVIDTLDYYNINVAGKKVVIVGRSNIVGKPLIPLLLAKNATVTICHSKTVNLSEETKQADIIVMAIGKAKFLKKEDIKEGAILIDVGINFDDRKIVGDIDFEDIKDKALACTPVPRRNWNNNKCRTFK